MFKWLYLALAFFPLSEAVLYPGVTVNYLKIQPFYLTLVSVVLLLGLRIWQKPKNSHVLAELGIYKLGPLITVVALLLRTIELFNYPNFIYTHFHVSLPQLGLLALHILVISLTLADWKKMSKQFSQNWFAISIYSFHLLLIYWINPAWFYQINGEDQLIEYLTSLVFFLGFVISFYNLKLINQFKLTIKQKLPLVIVIFGLGLFLLFVAGEEISWGQRIFDIPISQEFAATNTQEELNLHNNKLIFPFVYVGYLLINLYGLASWLIHSFFAKQLKNLAKLWLEIITTRWYYALFFLPNLIYVSARFTYGHVIIDQWEEISEIYLAIGLLIMVIHHLIAFKAYKHKA